ncbi:MAG: WYL domain-containing protein, partial [Planctomycetales bacterium]|nr:WYL domain-containing protein [Planctomycetales bacterium]
VEPSVAARQPLRPEPSDTLATSLRQSIRDGRKLRLIYCSADGQTTDRVVWPVTLGYAETSRLLIGWCELRQAFRHFRSDRIQFAEITEEPIGLRSGELRRRWQIWRDEELASLHAESPFKASE